MSKAPESKPEGTSENQTVANLRKVLALTSVLNSTLQLNELLGLIMKTSSEVMRSEVASLLLIDEVSNELVFRVALGGKGAELEEKFRVKMGEGIAGSVAASGKPEIVNEPHKDPRFAKRFDDSTGFVTKAILCVPMKTKEKIIGVLQAINPVDREKFSQEDLELFQTFADQAALAIENAQLHGEIVKQEKAKQALKIAHEIQQNFLPDLANRHYGIDLCALTLPAFDVGGDLYDVITLDKDRIGIILGDVSGKGVPAALYMVRAMSEYRFLAPQAKNPAELLMTLNQRLSMNSSFGMFLTLICLVIDKHTNTVQYSSAGHLPILLRKSESGTADVLKGAQSPPLGLLPETAFFLNTVHLEPNDALFLYTDGVIEARDRRGKEYSIERLAGCVKERAASAAAYSERVFADVRKFTTGAEQHDDITALTIVIP
ncbi:MAG TPA: SpoIIE family protein phosphatase [Candidatus Omnitrophota bacterium]|nr:SpoIIE family protein phosphatase [Candidatus Omnitrophota bacterium]